MSLEKNKKTILEIIIITVLVIFALLNISSIFKGIQYLIGLFMPFIIGCIMAFVLNVLLNLVENKLFAPMNKKKISWWKKWKRPVSLLVTFVIIIGVIAFLLYLVIPQLQNTTEIFTKNIDSYKEESVELLKKFGVGEKDVKNFNRSLLEFKDTAIDFISQNKGTIMDTTIGVASNIFSIITSFVLGLVFAIYVLLKKEDLGRQSQDIIKAYLPSKKEKKIQEISRLSYKTFGNFISGQCLEALIIGALCFIGMLILQIPYASTISVLVGFTALIPVFGAFIGTLIGAFLIFMVDPTKALIFIIFIIVLQQLEGNLIYPKVVGKSVGLPSIWVMVAVTVGASAYGIVGMMVSVPLCSVLYSIFRTNIKERLKKPRKSM